MASNNEDQLEVVVKLAMLPFPTAVTMTSEEYLQLLKYHEYKGFKVIAICMQVLDSMSVWYFTEEGQLIPDPVWNDRKLTEELPDDCEV